MLRVWAHVHTTYSYDGQCSQERIGAMARAGGIDVVLLSEHSDRFDSAGYERLLEDCRRWNGGARRPLFVAGLELTSASGAHILCFGLPRWIEPLRPDGEIVEEGRREGAFVALAHPSDSRLEAAAADGLRFDAIEVWNVKRSRFEARWIQCAALSERHHRALGWYAMAGLDAHDEPDFQPVRLDVEAERPERDAVLAALRQGRYRSVGRGACILPDGSYSVSASRRLTARVLAGTRRALKTAGAPLRRIAPGLFLRVRRRLSRHL